MTNKMLLGVASAYVSELGLVAVPAMIPPSLADFDANVLLHISPDLSFSIGLSGAELKKNRRLQISHTELQAIYDGVQGEMDLKTVLNPTTQRDDSICADTRDTGAVAFILSREWATKLGFPCNPLFGNKIFVMCQGGTAETVIDMFQTPGMLPILPSEVAAYFTGANFNTPVRGSAMAADAPATTAPAQQ